MVAETSDKAGQVDEDFIKWARHRFDREYFEGICTRKGWVIERFMAKSQFVDDKRVLKSLANGQALHLSNHLSHFDYVQQIYDFWKAGVEPPRIAARENVFVGPLKEVWEKCGAFKLPFGAMQKRQTLALRGLLDEMVSDGESFLLYPEGGRSYEGRIKEFKSGGVNLIHSVVQDKGRDYIVVPHYISYNSPIETSFLPLVKYAKSISRGAYVGLDAFAFIQRFATSYLWKRGKVVHVVGEPFSLLECKNGKEVCERARERIAGMEEIYRLN